MTVEYNTNELRYVSNTQKNKSIFWFKHTEKEAPNERERERDGEKYDISNPK